MTFVEDNPVAIDFPETSWEKWMKPGAEGRVKIVTTQGKRFRLMELPAGFDEENWCVKGHDGYVVEGEFLIIFEDGGTAACNPGMAFCIPEGVPHRSQGAEKSRTSVVVVDGADK